MKKYAQIIKGRVYWIGDFEKLPPLHPSIEMVEVTGADPMPQEGWLYANETFAPNDGKEDAKEALQKLDESGSFVRAMEDVLDVLIAKGILTLSDLPEAAQDKINERKTLRQTVNGG